MFAFYSVLYLYFFQEPEKVWTIERRRELFFVFVLFFQSYSECLIGELFLP